MEELTLRRVLINDAIFGEKTEVKDHVLSINRNELTDCLLEDIHLYSVEIEIARPGESKRIIPVKDVLEPRAKTGEELTTFPGLIGGCATVGTGTTCVLEGAAVVTSGKLVNFQEGLIDMTGPGAEFTGDSTDVWSHSWATVNSPVLDGVTIYRYSMEPEY